MSDNPVRYLRAARFFVLTSRFEGSPNAFSRRWPAVCPAVVSDASPGPLELIGMTMTRVSSFRSRMLRPRRRHSYGSPQDPALRVRLGQAAMARTEIHQLDRAMRGLARAARLRLRRCASPSSFQRLALAGPNALRAFCAMRGAGGHSVTAITFEAPAKSRLHVLDRGGDAPADRCGQHERKSSIAGRHECAAA